MSSEVYDSKSFFIFKIKNHFRECIQLYFNALHIINLNFLQISDENNEHILKLYHIEMAANVVLFLKYNFDV